MFYTQFCGSPRINDKTITHDNTQAWRKVEILQSRHRNNVFCVFFLFFPFFPPFLLSSPPTRVCRMSCFRGNRVWKLVKIDVDDGDEEWDETKANLSWIFKSRIPTQILWIWNFSDSVFWTSSIPLPSSFFPFSFFFYFYYLPFDAYEISLLWNLKSTVWWYRPLNSTSIFELLLIFWQGKLEGY